MSPSLVSVIVPTYNRAYCLPRTIDSVLRQTHAASEVILLDDGSTDGTRDLVRERYGREPRVRYFYQENQGVTATRNNALALARGDYVAFLDSDDWWEPWKLELQLACFARRPEVGMVWTDMQAIDPDGKVANPAYLRTMYGAYRWFPRDRLFPESFPLADIAPGLRGAAGDRRFYVGDIFSQMVMGNLVHTSTVLLRRDRLAAVKKFNEELRVSGEDYDFHLRTCRAGPVGYVDVSAIHYQTGMPDRLTRPSYRVHAASNCLKTILPVLANDRARIRLPRRMIRERLAEVHDWVGEALLEAGEVSRARGHLAASLWHKPLQPRTLSLLLLASLPAAVGQSVRGASRYLKSLVRRRPAPAAAARA
jgi:GT2 family glycosyltransferase